MLGFDAKKRKAGKEATTSGASNNANTPAANNPPASVIKCR